MRRGVSKCEMLEYLENTNSKDYDKVTRDGGGAGVVTSGSVDN